jgi:hypothetical protein
MRKIFLVFSLTVFLLSCQKKQDKVVLENKKTLKIFEKEGFDEFFIKFNKDSIFQASRIVFPLKNDIYDSDSNECNHKHIKKAEWKYFNSLSLSKEYIRNINKKKEETILNIQAVDTGINVDYVFILVKEQWFLIKIVDSST